jgi:hypothetical protein
VVPVLAHRLLSHGMRQGGRDLPVVGILESIMNKVSVPT